MSVRTTVTLDPDVEALIRAAMKERGISFKQALNTAIREGLSVRRPRKSRFIQKTYHMGAEQYFPWNKALAFADALEDEELLRRMSLRK